MNPVNALPTRVTRSQMLALPAVVVKIGVECVADRTCQLTPLPGVTTSITNRLSSRRFSRNMMPLFDQPFVFVCDVTCTVAVPFPASDW